MSDSRFDPIPRPVTDPSTDGLVPGGAFLQAYFAGADPAELEARDAQVLQAMARTHGQLLAATGADACAVQVLNPNLAEHGFAGEHSLVQIVHPDMPFLVDSVTMAINRNRLTAHWIVHPLVEVARDAAGDPVQVRALDPVAGASAGAAATSLIAIECDRIVAPDQRAALRDELLRVLADVRAAVQDWPRMLERLREASTELAGASLRPTERDEGLAFLRWLEDRHFTFLGARDYQLVRAVDGLSLVAVPDSGLGLLRGVARTANAPLPPLASSRVDNGDPLLVTKALTRSTVHRPAWLDCIAVKRLDAEGRVIGERRFLGLYTASAYAAPVSEVPRVRRSAAKVLQASGAVPDGHAAKTLQSILDAYPRDELFQLDAETLHAHAIGILRLQERQRTRLFLHQDPFGRFVSAQVFVPRDRYNTELRVRLGAELLSSLQGQSLEFTPTLTDNPLARIHYLIRLREDAPLPPVDVDRLEARLARLSQRWEDGCRSQLLRTLGEDAGLTLSRRFSEAFPAAYREDFPPAVGAEDAQVLAELSRQRPVAVALYRFGDAATPALRLKVYSCAKLALSDFLPLLEHMGARVLDERPYRVATDALWIHDLGLDMPAQADFAALRARFESLFLQAWHGEVESDALNRLVLTTGLGARDISLLRAYARYFRQTGLPFSQAYIEGALNRHSAIAQRLVELFHARFDPALGGDRAARQASLQATLEADLSQVTQLDDDRILRQFLGAMVATTRTNFWQLNLQGTPKDWLSFKFDASGVPGLPEPRPRFEIWVYAPRFEAVHLRFGKVARGGLRWSDRREDFRTEVLGLVKAQQVKNTVIVPVGSKGGFVLKRPPPAAQREALLAEAVACYRMFLSGMLDLTDNRVRGAVVPPARLVRHDDDDPYLVVAADKGTATFSDIANEVAAGYGFWLGDAFASGGSAGYDHKKMGITARGAWESAKRHFRMLGHDIQSQPFTVAGIGDMSGDVFGNGMLLSRQIRLVVAFDHRHIFIDPDPDCERSFAERERLFRLPRSSWDDYDRSLLSTGGGIHPRDAKSIPLSPQARARLGIASEALAPAELLRAILLAPVDLLYNGGIGTYVKASFESHAQAGDKASDPFRVDGRELRCKVLVEGGNLGCTQHGRIEFALAGGRIYSDAIDNSAGVDCSDHEVNIKVLLDRVVESGDMTAKQRNDLLLAMTDEVANLVLQDNYHQTQALELAAHRAPYLLAGQQRLIQALEAGGRLNRALEGLPGDEELQRRRSRGAGLSIPENAVVLAYAKMAMYDELLASDLPEDPYFARALASYFPAPLREQHGRAIDSHPLRREIIATQIANHVANRAGATFVHFLAGEAGTGAAEVVRAFTLAREVFDLEPLWDRIDALDGHVPAALQLDLLSRMITATQRAARWMLRARNPGAQDLPSRIARYQPSARRLRQNMASWLPGAAWSEVEAAAAALASRGVDPQLALDLAALEPAFPALDLTDASESAAVPLEQAAHAYFAIDRALSLTAWRREIARLPTETLWQTQARASARDDTYACARTICVALLTRKEPVAAWQQRHGAVLARLQTLLDGLVTQAPDLAPVVVGLREMRQAL